MIRYQQLIEKQGTGIQLDLFDHQQLSTKATLKDTAVMLHLTSSYAMSALPKNLQPLIYLPNKTINQIAQDMEVYLKLSELPYLQFKQQLGELKIKKRSEHALKNYMGNMVVQMSHPNYIKFSMNNHLINNEILVFNVLNQGITDIDVLNKNTQGYEFLKIKNKLCIKNPHPNPRSMENKRLSQNSCVKM